MESWEGLCESVSGFDKAVRFQLSVTFNGLALNFNQYGKQLQNKTSTYLQMICRLPVISVILF